MHVLVLRHEPFEHLGHFAALLRDRGQDFEYRDLGEHPSGDAVRLEDCQALIVMGGPMSANDPVPGLIAEFKLIEQALRQDLPILGICLGAQLLARALGAPVYRNPVSEIGWAPVYFTEAAASDALFSGLASPTTFFHWHGETFDLPHGAEWLAYSDRCRHQAYRFGRRAYGIQFHPEITAEMVEDWCAQPANCADVATLARDTGLRADAGTPPCCPIDPRLVDSRPVARRILDRWLALL